MSVLVDLLPPSPQTDERNREYLIRRSALGDNPTQEEMRAVVAYGLEQHRINFPHLYWQYEFIN